MLRAPTSIPQDYKSLKDEYIGLASELHSTLTENEKLKHELAWFRKQIFGKKSEKLLPENQLTLEGISPDASSDKVVTPFDSETKTDSPPENIFNKAKPGKKPLPRSLPRRRVVHEPPEVIGHENEFIKIGEDINEELNYIPAQVEVIEHVYPKYKPKAKENTKILQAVAISRPIFKGRPAAGLLAYILISKWCDHLPLDRLVKIFKRQKIDIPKSTMVFWITKCHELLLPIYEKMKEQILSGGYVLSDDTPVRVLDKSKPGTTHRGYLWVYGDLNQVVYDYLPGRSREGPHQFLENYTGFLQTDGYAAYNGIPTLGEIIRMGCWAHARREFFELKEDESVLTKKPLMLIGKLYEIERAYWDKEIEFETRVTRTEPILFELKKYLDATLKSVLPSSTIAGAIKYCLNQWEKLTVYYKHPQLKIDNNFSERCVKSAVIGRKNWLFFGSHEGGLGNHL